MIPVSRCRLQSEIGRVLVVGPIVRVHQRELDGTAVNRVILAVGTGEASKPGDSAEKLALDSRRTLRIAIALIYEDRRA